MDIATLIFPRVMQQDVSNLRAYNWRVLIRGFSVYCFGDFNAAEAAKMNFQCNEYMYGAQRSYV